MLTPRTMPSRLAPRNSGQSASVATSSEGEVASAEDRIPLAPLVLGECFCCSARYLSSAVLVQRKLRSELRLAVTPSTRIKQKYPQPRKLTAAIPNQPSRVLAPLVKNIQRTSPVRTIGNAFIKCP